MNSCSSNYCPINHFGSSNEDGVNNPLSYCIGDTIDQRFLHGSNAYLYGQASRPCQIFLPQYCSQGWDSYCEMASKNTNSYIPNLGTPGIGKAADVPYRCTTLGDKLIRDTFSEKFLVTVLGSHQVSEPFDPNVANSPHITYWRQMECQGNSGNCGNMPVYNISNNQITTLDSDIVVNKVLDNPQIALDILVNIYYNMKNDGRLNKLNGTKLGIFFATTAVFKNI